MTHPADRDGAEVAGGPPVAVVGGGVGGLTTAVALRQLGHEAVVVEQARRFAVVGADVNLTPNAVRALDGLGLGAGLREAAARPARRISRRWDTGEITSSLEMSDAAEARYGSPQLTIHRARLIEQLERRLPPGAIRLGCRVSAIRADGDGAAIVFDDGRCERFAAVVGADGIHSAVRRSLFGQDAPRFTGLVAFRAVVPASRLAGIPHVDSFTKWWGADPFTQIVTFPLDHGREVFVFATIAQDSWTEESWTLPGSVDELRSLYADFHPEATALLDACDGVFKTALYERDPMPTWFRDRAVLLGDACHPMLPFMAQGAGMAIEDAVVLARCYAARPDQPAVAFSAYTEARRERTAAIQRNSRENNWLKEGGNADWVYGYDAWAEDVPATPPPLRDARARLDLAR